MLNPHVSYVVLPFESAFVIAIARASTSQPLATIAGLPSIPLKDRQKLKEDIGVHVGAAARRPNSASSTKWNVEDAMSDKPPKE